MRIRTKRPAIRGYLKSSAPLVRATADRVAARASGTAGTVDGEAPVMRRGNGVGAVRARSVVIGQHPTPKGRKAAADALRAALGAGA